MSLFDQALNQTHNFNLSIPASTLRQGNQEKMSRREIARPGAALV
jgi:hypothetical protein